MNDNTGRNIVIGAVVVLLVLGILKAGIMIGYHKARYAGNFGNNFERNFVGPRGGNMMFFSRETMPSGHGAVGEIISINLPRITISSPDLLEKTLLLGTSTLIRRFQQEIKMEDLKVGDRAVILGNPNESGEIEVKLMRLMPQ